MKMPFKLLAICGFCCPSEMAKTEQKKVPDIAADARQGADTDVLGFGYRHRFTGEQHEKVAKMWGSAFVGQQA